jgi:hypothetical protein
VTPEAFEAVVRGALAERDKRRKARLFDITEWAAADQALVDAVLEAAGYELPEDAGKAATRARRAAKKNTVAAFGSDAA